MKHNPNQAPDPTETRRLFLAIALSLMVIFGWQVFVTGPEQQRLQAQKQQEVAAVVAQPGNAAPLAAPVPAVILPRAEVLANDAAAGNRIIVNGPSVHGSINLVGARFDDLTLARYHETPDKASPEIVLLSPGATTKPYYAEFGWRSSDSTVKLPGPDTRWQASASTLSPAQPVTLSWDNGQGLLFTRTVSVDDNYMFSVVDAVENKTGAAITLFPYGLVARTADLKHPTTFILHEGPIGIYGGQLGEDNYKDLVKEQPVITRSTTGGWLGFTDKYWLVALVPDANVPVSTRTVYAKAVAADRFQVDFTSATGLTVPAGATTSTTNRLFAGAKEVRLLDSYEKELGITKFDHAVDFGWFYFMTKPFFYALDYIARWFGNFGVAILLFTVVIKLLVFPLANHGYKSMTRMKALAPKMMELRETYPNDPQRQSQELMALYKREGVNPLSGCWPMLIQIPIFFALYKVLFVSIEMRHAPFYGWLTDLSAADPSNIFTLFGLLPWTPPSLLHIGILPILMGLTMWLQMKMNPPPTDPTQKMVFGLMPPVMVVMMAAFPAGLVLYWTWSNLLSILQQYAIMRQMNVKIFDEAAEGKK